MSIDIPEISVIVPTHNRKASLQRLLGAIQMQDYPLEKVEVVVVADGCKDGTVEMLQKYKSPFSLHYVEQPGQGAAIARNQGAARASGTLLLFLDDDIEPSPQLISAHVSTHQCKKDQVVIGYLPPLIQNRSSFFHISLWAWWEDKFHMMRQRDHRFTYEDLLSGNFSISSELFHQIGGFDSTLRCREDYELGARLIKAAAQFAFAVEAWGYHCDEVTDLNRSLRRKRQEAIADVKFGRSHPDLMYKLRLSSFGATPFLDWILINLIFWMPLVSDQVAAGLRQLMNFLELLKMQRYWQRFNQRLHGYWYLRGLVDEFKTYKALLNFLQGGIIRSNEMDDEIELDLRKGVAAAEQILDKKRPKALRIFYGSKPVGYVPLQAGTERLRGIHLRSILLNSMTPSPLMAILSEKTIEKTNNKVFDSTTQYVPVNSIIDIDLAEELHGY